MVHVESTLDPIPMSVELILQAARAALGVEKAAGDVTVVLGDDAQLRNLNRNYLGTDAATDVLSFPAGETDPETGEPYLGDVVISVPRAELQARAAGHPLQAELQLLIVHGVLHLLGHDHGTRADKARMWKQQARALQSLGLAHIEIRE